METTNSSSIPNRWNGISGYISCTYIYIQYCIIIYISLCTKSMLVVTTRMGAAWHEPIWAHLELPEPFCKAGAGGGDDVVSKSFSVAKWTFQNSDVQTNELKFGKESSNANSYWKSGQCLERSHFTATTKENNAIILSFMYWKNTPHIGGLSGNGLYHGLPGIPTKRSQCLGI